MYKQLIAGITALSMTFATAAPSHANGIDREDVGKLLIGLAAIAAINAAIENNNDSRNDDVTPTRGRNADQRHDWADLNRPGVRNSSRTLPSACLQRVSTRIGTQRIYDRQCLTRNYRHANRLPDRCAVRLFTTNGTRRGFDPYCLRDEGFQVTRRN